MIYQKNLLISILLIFNLAACQNFKPVYKDNIATVYKLQNITIISNKNKISKKIRKQLLNSFPTNKNTQYILKIEAFSNNAGIVNDLTRKISRYKIKTIAEIKLYRRLEKKDKKVFSFIEEKEAAYNLVSDNVRSTLASRNKAENTTVSLVSESIYNRLIMYLSNK